MAFNLKRQLYEALPAKIKQAACLVPFSLWAGKDYRQMYQQGKWLDGATRENLLLYQEKQLKDVLLFATNQVPAYKNLRTVVEHFRPFDALREFPFINKETIQREMDRFLPESFNNIPHYEVTTGGTSGNQLKLYLDDHSQAVENAFQHRLWKRVGYSIRKRRVTFRGVNFPNLKPGIYWQHNPIYNELQFSPFHMNNTTLPVYIEQIIKFNPEYIYGYPSAIDLLAEYVIRNNMVDSFPIFTAALLISEGINWQQRQRIEKAFRTRVFSFYGHTERVIMGGECEKTTTYHHFPDYGILEIIGSNGHQCSKPGERGELVGTGFLNKSLPLIRYRTGDQATRLDPHCECGRCWDRFTDVEGRWKQDMIVGRTGSRVSITALNMHGPLFEKVIRYQYFQENAGTCILRVVVSPEFKEKDRAAIETAYRNKVGDEILFKVQIVSEIPLTARGKLKLLESSLMEKT